MSSSSVLQLPNIKKRKRLPDGARAVERSMSNRARKRLFTINQSEFARRKRFIDTDGNEYALPRKDDMLYKQQRQSGMIDDIDELYFVDEDNGDNDTEDKFEQAISVRSKPGKAMLYIRKKRGQELRQRPRGTIELLDLDTKFIYSADVRIVMFDGQDKHGHILFKDMQRTKRVGDVRRFTEK